MGIALGVFLWHEIIYSTVGTEFLRRCLQKMRVSLSTFCSVVALRESRLACPLGPRLCCSPCWTTVNGADRLRSPNSSQSYMSWGFLKKEFIGGKFGTKDRRKGKCCPKSRLRSEFWYRCPRSLGECGRQSPMLKRVLGDLRESKGLTRPSATETFNCVTRTEMGPREE